MMTEEELRECLMLYGTQIEEWPLELRTAGLAMLHHAHVAALFSEYREMEQTLHDERRFEPASPELASRIIYAARTLGPARQPSFLASFSELLDFLLPRPAYAIAAVVALGVVAGAAVPAFTAVRSDNDVLVQGYFNDEGALL